MQQVWVQQILQYGFTYSSVYHWHWHSRVTHTSHGPFSGNGAIACRSLSRIIAFCDQYKFKNTQHLFSKRYFVVAKSWYFSGEEHVLFAQHFDNWQCINTFNFKYLLLCCNTSYLWSNSEACGSFFPKGRSPHHDIRLTIVMLSIKTIVICLKKEIKLPG